MVKNVMSGDGRDGKAAAFADLGDGFDIVMPGTVSSAMVFSSPHSGSHYLPAFLSSSKLDALSLRRSEDCHVDELFSGAADAGAPLLRAHFPRAYLDVNREAYELDPRMFTGRLPAFANTRSLRVAGGLGTIARIVGDGQEIYATRIPVEDALNRIETLYKPYHHALTQLLFRARERFGLALLVDCHSMPSGVLTTGKGDDVLRADVVIGDRYGASCDLAITHTIDDELRRRGYHVQRNKPYAGGFITEHYGSPHGHCHAVQIEINRALYMDELTLQRNANFEIVQRDMAEIALVLAELMRSGLGAGKIAAE